MTVKNQLGDNSPDGQIAPGLHQEVITCGSAKTLVPADSGALVLLNIAAGSTLTLPASPEAGMFFDVAVTVSVTSNAHTVTPAAATTFLLGGIQQMIDTTAVSEGQFADGATHLTIAMNGTTTGGLIGTVLRFTALSATQWVCSGLVASSGTLATPFTT